MDISIIILLTLAALVIASWVKSLFTGKGAKNVHSDISETIGAKAKEIKNDIKKQAIKSHLEWEDELQDEFELDAQAAITQAYAIEDALNRVQPKQPKVTTTEAP